MLSHNELSRGTYFLFNNEPYEVLESAPLFKGRGTSVKQARIKNIKTGTVLQKSFHTGETFEEIDLVKQKVVFIYKRKKEYIFSYATDPHKRFTLTEEQLGNQAQFLVANHILDGLVLNNEVITASLPIKVQLKVMQAPPGVHGNSAQGGTKNIIVESGAAIDVPLFVQEGDIIEINTETSQYTRRIQE